MPPPAEGIASRLIVGPTLRTQPDRRLVELVRSGYEAAFEEIVRRYARPLGRYAAAIVGGHSEEVTQDAFSKALIALRRDGEEIDLRPWLYRIVRNTALNDLRDRPPAPESLAEAVASGRSVAEELERREEVAELLKRLRDLPDAQRAAIVMRELEGLSHEEIAGALGLSGGAARQMIYRARQALRDGLGLLVPMPVVRALVEHAEEAAGASGAIAAGAGASSAGGAVKAGMATVLIAGAVGAGVAVKQREVGDHGPQEAKAALQSGGARGTGPAAGSTGEDGASGALEDRDGGRLDDRGRGGGRDSENRGPGESEGSSDSGHGSDDSSDPRRSIDGSGPGTGSRHEGPGEDGSGGGGPGPGGEEDSSGPSASSDEGGSSGSGGDDGGGGSSGPGGGEIQPTAESDPLIEESSNSGPGSDSSGGGGDLSGSQTSGSDG